MQVVKFKATLASGHIIIGPIQGSGGKLGSAALHAGIEFAQENALARIRQCQRLAAKGRRVGIYTPSPGCCAIYPNFSAESDGPKVHVPLVGTKFEIAND